MTRILFYLFCIYNFFLVKKIYQKLQFFIFNNVTMQGLGRTRPYIIVKGRTWRNISSIYDFDLLSHTSKLIWGLEIGFTSYGGNNLFAPLTSFKSQLFSYLFMKHWTLLTHTPRNRKHQWSKSPLFNFYNTSVIISGFFSCSCFFRILSVVRWICDGEWVFVTLTSKKVHTPLTHLFL